MPDGRWRYELSIKVIIAADGADIAHRAAREIAGELMAREDVVNVLSDYNPKQPARPGWRVRHA